jgi:2-C-methyl-D-erythritol 2,4-cyclodiphosphate synthase
MRVGIGYDVHCLVLNSKLILGGVTIPCEKGLLGYSDADVLTHAIMDSLLGAAGLGDIGIHFPDTEEKYKNISSMKLLAYVYQMLLEKKYTIVNIDATVIAQEPKMKPYTLQMRKNIAQVLDLTTEKVNIKATTEEGLGFTGAKEGIAAQAICMIQSENS